MATRGRKPKPTALRLLDGDRASRINTTEPIPSELPVEAPEWLSEAAREVWDRLAPDRIAKGVLTAWDVDAFALFCTSLALAVEFSQSAAEQAVPGAASPLSNYRTAVGLAASLGAQFGWAPSDRSRLNFPPSHDPREDLLT